MKFYQNLPCVVKFQTISKQEVAATQHNEAADQISNQSLT